jgi:hypothetical protein
MEAYLGAVEAVSAQWRLILELVVLRGVSLKIHGVLSPPSN